MNTATLQKAMPGLSDARAKQLVEPCNAAMVKGKITTSKRAAAFLAQIGHESTSLRYKEEIGPQPYWSGYGGGGRYHGRTFIQVTHDYNYRAFGQWLGVGDRFVKRPELLERDDYAWLGPVWYWTRHNLNAYADRGDFRGLTEAINGRPPNGVADRESRHRRCLHLGDAILPEDPDPLRGLTPRERHMAERLLLHRHRMDREAKTGKGPRYLKEQGHAAAWKAAIRLHMRKLQRDARAKGRGGWDKDNRGGRYQTLKKVVERKIK